MRSTTDRVRSTFDDFSCYVDDCFAGVAPDVAEAWHGVLQTIEDRLLRAELAPGFRIKLVEVEPDPEDETMDDERTAVRLELSSRHMPDVVLHLSTEHYDALPKLTIWTRARQGVGLLDREWDELAIDEALARFIDRHQQRARERN